MADNHPALQYAHFRLKDKVGLPADLFVGTEDCLQAANFVLPKPSLLKDFELVAQYGDWSRQKQELEEKRRQSQDLLKGVPDAVIAQSAAAATSAVPETMPLHSAVTPTVTDKLSAQETAVNEMMRETNESKDVCIFYLESTNWDLASAVELLRSMQVR